VYSNPILRDQPREGVVVAGCGRLRDRDPRPFHRVWKLGLVREDAAVGERDGSRREERERLDRAVERRLPARVTACSGTARRPNPECRSVPIEDPGGDFDAAVLEPLSRRLGLDSHGPSPEHARLSAGQHAGEPAVNEPVYYGLVLLAARMDLQSGPGEVALRRDIERSRVEVPARLLLGDLVRVPAGWKADREASVLVRAQCPSVRQRHLALVGVVVGKQIAGEAARENEERGAERPNDDLHHGRAL
jgi:hypothetical protein